MKAVGKLANAICDRCGLTYRLHELRKLMVNTKLINIRVCPECWEPDQPQNSVGRYRVDDNQSLYNPRPDSTRAACNGIARWNPIIVNSLKITLGVTKTV